MIHVVGLGPGDWDRTDPRTRELLLDPSSRVVVRTSEHPAAATLGSLRQVSFCDDLYRASQSFGDVYDSIAARVMEHAETVDTVYAVPGSPQVGEFAVAGVREAAELAGIPIAIHPAESFIDAIFNELGVDPFREGFKLLDGHELPDPLIFDVPTVIGHVGMPAILSDVLAHIDRVVPEDTEVCVLAGLGASDALVVWGTPTGIDSALAGVRTSVFVPATSGGLIGAVHAMSRLRADCPWDREQTHHSLVRFLLEETHELIDALAALPTADVDYGAYADVEEELGDVLLQVLFHAVIASEEGAFDISDVAEQLRRKLVRRHPHVFGDVVAADAETVKANWDVIKAEEKAHRTQPRSAVDGVPPSLPGLARAFEVQRRAAKVGFDWPGVEPVIDKLYEEARELRTALGDGDATLHELGDVLFTIVNAARHLDQNPEVAILHAVGRFESRFRAMEAMGSLEGLTLEQLDARWERAKQGEA